MYVESQVGNQCRRHALNNMFGGSVVEWDELANQATEFETYYHLPSTRNMQNDLDYFNADGSSLLTWVAEKKDVNNHMYVVLPRGRINEWVSDYGYKSLDEMAGEGKAMIFRDDHVYSIRKDGGQWYVLDSLSPYPQRTSLSSLEHNRTLGVIVPLPEIDRVIWNLTRNIQRALHPFETSERKAVETIVSRGIGDVHDKLEIWAFTRLRLLKKQEEKKINNFHNNFHNIFHTRLHYHMSTKDLTKTEWNTCLMYMLL